MKYVKLIARPDSWFKEGTEVYSYESDPPSNPRRVSEEEWIEAVKLGWNSICVRGIRVIQCEYEIYAGLGRVGDERWDGELCSCDEFEATITEESK